jgi:hypothetical protein
MEPSDVSKILPNLQQPPQQNVWFYFICLLIFLIFILYSIIYGMDIANVSNSWAENRCKPHIMPFASLYGYNTAENFKYCMTNIIKDQAGDSLGPIYQILSGFIGTISTLVQMANSLRVSLATLFGGITKVFQEFGERINSLIVRIRVATVRIKMLFGRLFATFYAVIYMGMSGITAVSNFGDTFLFKFLDTFCFDPDTLVEIEGKGQIPVKDVIIGDIFSKTKSRVTATFAFYSNGQDMVLLPQKTPNYSQPIIVSTNHYVRLPSGQYEPAAAHPAAIPIAPWAGGTDRPLICFNTDDHKIPIGDYLFLDYDETECGDRETMRAIKNIVNNSKDKEGDTIHEYSPGVSDITKIALKQTGTFCVAKNIKLGQTIQSGKIVGIVKKEVKHFVRIGQDLISASSLIWRPKTDSWERAYNVGIPIQKNDIAYSFVVTPSATIMTHHGLSIRDYVEVHSPDSEDAYKKEISIQYL